MTLYKNLWYSRGEPGLKLLGGPGLHLPLPPSYGIYIFLLEFAKLLGGPGPPGPLNAAMPLYSSFGPMHQAS